jgi:hypothetical protein
MAKSIFAHVYGAVDIFAVCIDVALVMALYPTIKGFITAASGNMSAAEVTLSGLIPLVLVIALIYTVGTQLGLFKKRK